MDGSLYKSLQKTPRRMLPKITQKIFITGCFAAFFFVMFLLMGCLWICFDIADHFQNGFYVVLFGAILGSARRSQ